jgi:hypothetical protein
MPYPNPFPQLERPRQPSGPHAENYATFAVASDNKRGRIPAFCLDLFAYSMISVMKRDDAPLVSVAAALFPNVRPDLRQQVALALIAGEVKGDLYLIPRITAWRSVREVCADSTYQPHAANLLFADPYGAQPNCAPLLYLPDLDAFQFSTEDPRDCRGSQTPISLWAKIWAAVACGLETPVPMSRAQHHSLSD